MSCGGAERQGRWGFQAEGGGGSIEPPKMGGGEGLNCRDHYLVIANSGAKGAEPVFEHR